MKYELKLEEWSAFEQIIELSIVERYDGDLEYVGEDKYGDPHFKPLDKYRIRQLLVDLWGDRLTPRAIEDAFSCLIQDESDWRIAALRNRAELERLEQLEDELVLSGTLIRE